MYEAQYKKNGELMHSEECKMAFGRKDALCPRCQELMNGAETRVGYGHTQKALDILNSDKFHQDKIAAAKSGLKLTLNSRTLKYEYSKKSI